MPRYAIVQNGVVVNTVVAESGVDIDLPDQSDLVLDSTAGPGWTYDGEQFYPPVIQDQQEAANPLIVQVGREIRRSAAINLYARGDIEKTALEEILEEPYDTSNDPDVPGFMRGLVQTYNRRVVNNMLQTLPMINFALIVRDWDMMAGALADALADGVIGQSAHDTVLGLMDTHHLDRSV